MKPAKSLCVVFLLILGVSDSFARNPENIIEILASGQYADFQFTLPNGTKGGIDPVTKKELQGEIVYDNSYLGDITGRTNNPAKNRYGSDKARAGAELTRVTSPARREALELQIRDLSNKISEINVIIFENRQPIGEPVTTILEVTGQ